MGRPRDSDACLPKQLRWWALIRQTISVGGQKKCFKDTLNKTLTSFNINVANWEVCAQDRPLWHSMIHTGARTAETNRIAEAQKKRATLSPAPQPARHTHAPRVEECCRPELERLATSAPTWSTKHDIIINEEKLWSSSETMDEQQHVLLRQTENFDYA